jgi:hypothetical protein
VHEQAIRDRHEVRAALADEEVERAQHDGLRGVKEDERGNEAPPRLRREEVERAQDLRVLLARERRDERLERAHVQLGQIGGQLLAAAA